MNTKTGSTYIQPGFNPKFGLCIDWETSGSEFGGDSTIDYQGIAFGAAIFKFSTFEIIDKMKRYIKFNTQKYKWTESAEKIHGISKDFLNENGVASKEAAEDLANFVFSYFGPAPNVMVLGHNVDFDIAFTKQLLIPYEVMFKIHHVKLDTSGAGLIAFGKYKSDQLFELIGLPDRGAHDPLQDVEYTIELAKSIRLLINSALDV